MFKYLNILKNYDSLLNSLVKNTKIHSKYKFSNLKQDKNIYKK